MKIVVKVNEDKELVFIHCSDKNCEVVLYDYYACVVNGDATEEEMDRGFKEETKRLHQVFDERAPHTRAFSRELGAFFF